MKNDKWEMFKNYMHNELGVTKDDIRAWIKEAATEQAEKMVQQEFGKFDIKQTITKFIKDDLESRFSNLREPIVREIVKNLKIEIK